MQSIKCCINKKFYLVDFLVLIEAEFRIENSRLIRTAMPVRTEVLHHFTPYSWIDATCACMCHKQRLISFFLILNAHWY